MAKNWVSEACDLADDPQSGARITRLTSAVMSNINIYCEQPYSTPDGRYIAYTRSQGPDPRVPPFELCIADIERLKVASIEPVVANTFIGTSSWSGKIYYIRPNGELICVDLATLEKQIIITHWELPLNMILDSVSPDHRYLVGVLRQPNYKHAILRVDLQQRNWKIIFEHDELLSHVQFNHANGRDILVQMNRGMAVDNFGRIRRIPDSDNGVTHFYIDAEGGNYRALPLGNPYTANTCGHAAWIADTGRIGVAVNWPGMSARHEDLARGIVHDERHPQGNFLVVGPQDEKAHVFAAPEHIFNHVNVSKDGSYFVCDSYRNGIPGPIELVVGNIETGKYRTLVSDCGAQGGGPACSHPHAYFTADNRNIIYNGDPHNVCHVHAARVPDEFYASLE